MTIANRVSPTVVLSSGPPLALKVLYCLRKLGVATHLVDIAGPSIARHSRYKQAYAALDLDTLDAESGLREQLVSYVRRNGIRAIVPADIAAAGFLHECRDFLDGVVLYPTSPLATLEQLDDKWSFYELMRTLDIPTPNTRLVRSASDIDALAGSIVDYPVMVKPLFAESGHGIACAQNATDLRCVLANRAQQGVLPVIVQQRVPGEDADISVLVRHGRVVASIMQAKQGLDDLSFFHDDTLLGIVEKIMSKLNYDGVANIDIRRDPETGEVAVLECNPRFWYTLQASLWRGVNFVEIGLDTAIGHGTGPEPIDHGRYVLHGRLCKHTLWSPRAWTRLKSYNLRGLAQALGDPLPFMMAAMPRVARGWRAPVRARAYRRPKAGA